MIHTDSKINLYSQEDSEDDTGDLSPWEIDTMEVLDSEENREKKLFEYFDECFAQ